jgi:predicted small secreted protein
MKYFLLFLLAVVSLALTACGTIGGTLSGAGQDLSASGEWVRSIGQ